MPPLKEVFGTNPAPSRLQGPMLAPAPASAIEAVLRGALHAKDPGTLAHVERVVGYARSICESLEQAWRKQGKDLVALPSETVLRRAALFHDLGKIAVADAILKKPGALTEVEREEMRGHPGAGRGMLADFGGELLGDAEVLAGVLHHHERWDGEGYPGRLTREGIPLIARIIAVADAYDAMTSIRPYRAPMDHSEAVREIERGSGTQFDPEIAAAFIRCVWSECD